MTDAADGPATGKEEMRERILEAAAAAIAARGFHGMSMRKLARATGRSLASFYHYFASKDEVLLALHQRAFETLTATATQALAKTADPVAQLYLFVANHVGYFVQHGAVMRVLVQEAAALPTEQRQHVRLLKERYFEIARAVVEGIARERGSAMDRDAAQIERATYCVFGMMNWVYGWYDPERHGRARDVAHTIHQLALCGLVGAEDMVAVRAAMDQRIASGELPSPLRRRGHDEQAA